MIEAHYFFCVIGALPAGLSKSICSKTTAMHGLVAEEVA